MKKLLPVIFISFFILSVSSCRKNVVPSPEPPGLNKLVVNDNFDWQTSTNILFSIQKTQSGVITITSESGDILYHKGFFNGLNPTYDVAVWLPKYVKQVLVNGHLVDVTGTTVTVNLENKKISSYKKQAVSTLNDDRIAYWPLNENSGNTAADVDGHSDGAIKGARWTSGINQSALNFNGTDGEVEIPLNSTLNIVNDKMSLSVWFKKDFVKDDGSFLFCRTKYILRMDNHGKITFAIYNPGWHAITIPWANRIIDTDWHHVVATYDGQKIKLYIDAVLLAEKSTSGKLKTSSSPVYIGSEHPLNYFDGALDEVAVYDKALTQAEVSQLYADTPNPGTGADYLISQWKLNENTGTAVFDSKGSNDGGIYGAKWSTGVEGASLEFNGKNDYVTIPNADNLNVNQQITIMAWAKTEENKTAKIVEKGDWDGHGLLQDKWNGWGGTIRLGNNKSYSLTWGNGVPVFGEWYHLAMTYNGAVLKLFVNGQLVNSKAVSGSLHVNSRDFFIGSNNGSQKFFKGCIDDVRIYSKALTKTEIQAVFDNKDNSGNTDADGDGVQDADDDYPNDPARAFNNYLPAAGFASLAFEDLWPGKGDYDFNDLVIDYRFTTVTNASNKVADVLCTFVIRAIGAGQSNGFGFQLSNANVSAADMTVSGSDLRSNYIQLDDNGTEANQNKPTVIVFDDVNQVMPPEGGFGVNVEPDKPWVKPDTILISIAFTTNKYISDDIDLIHFNPFLIVNKTRGKEIHLPDYPPTALVDASLFGTMDDSSNPNTGRYYKTANNLPWALNISESFDYLIEKNEITTGYLKFYDWAVSSGANYPDWYKNKAGYRNDVLIYPVPEN